MAKAILMPQVGQDLTEGKLIELKVKLGDKVKRGDIVAVVESEKATFDVEAFDEGTVIALPYGAGDLAEVLKPLIYVGAPGEKVTEGPEKPSASKPNGALTAKTAPLPGGRQHIASRGSSPLARRLAAQAGVDLSGLEGTGPGAAIIRRDVEKALRDGTPRIARTAAPLAEQSYKLDGPLTLRTLRAGHGMPVVLLHGFGGDLSAWRQIAGSIRLPNPLVAIDLPGHGSSALPTGMLDLAAMTLAIDRGLEAAGIGEVHIVGHSLGAAIAIALATSGRRHVRSLTLLAPAGLGETISGEFLDRFTTAKDEAQLSTAMALLVEDKALLTPTLLRATHAQRTERKLEDGQIRLKEALFPGGRQTFALGEALSHYAGALRIVIGAKDRIIKPSTKAFPASAALHVFPETGHMPQLEQAELTAKLIAATVTGSDAFS
jgi:pimeloyl-ACP methyl ester carboxylesterase